MATEAPWKNAIVRIGEEPPDQLLAHPRNPKVHPKHQQDAVSASIDRVGWIAPVLVNQRTQNVLDGHARIALAISKGEPTVPVLYIDVDEADEPFVLATFDPTGYLAVHDKEMLEALLADVDTDDEALQQMLSDLAANAGVLSGLDALGDGAEPERKTLNDQFLVPPFTVLDARQGYWQDRKRAWIDLGIQSELGRGDNALGLSDETDDYRQGKGDYAKDAKRVVPGGGGDPKSTAWKSRGPNGYEDAPQSVRGRAKAFKAQASLDELQGNAPRTGTSIFDPVLCEVVYRWFCPPDGLVFDPFAGGSVRGIVASRLGRRYAGIELREEQVEANRAQARAICPHDPPTWHVGDSLVMDDLVGDLHGGADLVFTCPPYADLEVYSDDPRDLSAMAYPDFLEAYRRIIALAVERLKPDRFAAIVVGDVRDPKGVYRGLVGDTIRAFADAGAALYNDAVLVTMVGSLPIRAGMQFKASRKLGRSHQNVLVFCKGNPKRATEACGPIELADTDPNLPAGGGADADDQPWA